MFAFLFYLFGMASMLLSDILISKFLSTNNIALWADSRALFGILAAFVTLGLEAVIIRSPEASRLLLRLVFIQAIFISIPLGFLVHQLGYLSSAWSAILLSLGAAFSLAQGQYFRSRSAFSVSQLVQQGWKIVVFIILAGCIFSNHLLSWPIDLIASTVISIFALIGWGILFTSKTDRESSQQTLGKYYAISLRFFFTNIILMVALFGEQMIVGGLGTRTEAAVYFTHVTYFLLPVTIVSTFAGFRIGPWVRDNSCRFETILLRHRKLIIAVILSSATLAMVVGWVGWSVIRPSVGEPNVFLVLSFFITAIMRSLYIIPSVFNGIFGESKDYDFLIFSQLLLMLVLAAAIYLTLHLANIIFVAAFVGFINWIVRTLISCRVMKAIVIRRQRSSTRPRAYALGES